ncbi:pseudouridine synthase [Thozetella sp. PMI_491]|nr:pseudouridine synthase [Thozetella sp. PMI_491]
MTSHPRHQTHVPAVRVEVEKTLGITQRAAPVNFAWTGDIRKRYTDFLVYEIAKDGTVIHLYDYPEETPASANLTATSRQVSQNSTTASSRSVSGTSTQPTQTTQPTQPAPVPEVKPISDDDRGTLAKLIDENTTKELIELDEDIQAQKWSLVKGKSIKLPVIEDRDARRMIHQEIRRIFSSRLDTAADANGTITATQNKQRNRRRDGRRMGPRNQSFEDLGGDYLHLTLYKENKDTMDAVNTMARLLKVKASNFAFAGTKDRRAATVQRISIAKQRSHNVIWLNSRLAGMKAGDFTHSTEPLCLGQHSGNEFIIVLKNCQPLSTPSCSFEQRLVKIRDAVDMGLAFLKARGYINYYGLQRFGTHTISTHLLGMKILSGDFEGVIDDILHVDDHLVEQVLDQAVSAQTNATDEMLRARALTTWKMTKNAQSSLSVLPKRFSAETAIIRHLSLPTHHRDFMGSILNITRGMRMMYIHAYQSYVWNHVASLRWSKYGTTVIVGDLVLADTGPRPDGAAEEDLRDSYEEEEFYARARHLTIQDIASSKYHISDVILPTPGFDVIYPNNDIGEFYKEFMGRPENGKLNPFDMRRKQREFSLSGNYRPLLGRLLGTPMYGIRTYSDDSEQMYPTDLDICTQNKANQKAASESKQRQERMGKDKDMSAWNHFASNPAQWDKAMASENRRKAENEPLSEGVTRVQETWVQTGLDDRANKRVKLTRETHERLETTVPDKKETLDISITLTDDNGSNASAGGNPPSDKTNYPSLAEAVYGSKSNEPPASSESNSAQRLADILRTSERQSENTQSIVGTEGVSSSTEIIPDIVVEPIEVKAETPKNDEDPLGWFGKDMPDVKAPILAASANDDVKPPVSDGAHIHGVPIPVLRPVSENPILAFTESNLSSEGIDTSTGGNKIAVILKFQLKSSNYATVVLRELMGVPPNTSTN